MKCRLFRTQKNGKIKYLTALVSEPIKLVSFIKQFNVKGFRYEVFAECIYEDGSVDVLDLKHFIRKAKLEIL